MEGDVMMQVQEVSEFSKFINDYGFLIVFGAVMLLAVGTAIFMFLRSWNKREGARIASEAEKTKVELELLTKERMSHIEQNKKTYELVTTVQTEQVNQMRAISEIINNLKNEVMNNGLVARETLANTDKMSNDVSGILIRMETISKEIEEVTEKVESCHQLETQIYDILNSLR